MRPAAPGSERWCLRLAWDGTSYVGWQRQPKGTSIQGRVEEALQALSGAPRTAVASGRTDAGVHARAQVVATDLPPGWVPARVKGGLNHHLPDDIVCLEARRAPDAFDPRRWVRRKHYRYRFLAREARCPFRAAHTSHIRGRLDVDAMQRAASALEGRHDFEAFRARGCSAAHAVRTLESARVVRREDEVHLDVLGNGFVRHQVRIFAGTMIEVGMGRMGPQDVQHALSARERSAAGPTAPPRGLWLMEVELAEAPHWESSADPAAGDLAGAHPGLVGP